MPEPAKIRSATGPPKDPLKWARRTAVGAWICDRMPARYGRGQVPRDLRGQSPRSGVGILGRRANDNALVSELVTRRVSEGRGTADFRSRIGRLRNASRRIPSLTRRATTPGATHNQARTDDIFFRPAE